MDWTLTSGVDRFLDVKVAFGGERYVCPRRERNSGSLYPKLCRKFACGPACVAARVFGVVRNPGERCTGAAEIACGVEVVSDEVTENTSTAVVVCLDGNTVERTKHKQTNFLKRGLLWVSSAGQKAVYFKDVPPLEQGAKSRFWTSHGV